MAFRLANVGGRAALVLGDHYHDLQTASGGELAPDPMAALRSPEQLHALTDALDAGAPTGALADVTLDAPVPRPRNSYGIGLNYQAHADESSMEVPKAPPSKPAEVEPLVFETMEVSDVLEPDEAPEGAGAEELVQKRTVPAARLQAAQVVAVVNGRITELSHAQYLLFRDVLPQFNRISLFCVQLEEYAERFRRLHVEEQRILVTGNVKVDGLEIGRVDPGPELARLLGASDRPVVVAGSTHDPEELEVARLWQAHVPDARLILVPRHPKRCTELTGALAEAGFDVQRLSRLRAGEESPDPARPVVVDTIGELERIYGLADLVFVGGSLLPHGGHNMLEPAAQGCATLFGPHVTNFAQEAALLELAGGCRRVPTAAALGEAMRALLDDPAERERMGRAAMDAVRAQRGATAMTLDAVDALSLRRIVGDEDQGRSARFGA